MHSAFDYVPQRSPEQIAAYRADVARRNGAKSNGPVTEEGKRKSSRNALKHGLTAEQNVTSGEFHADYEAFLADFIEAYDPLSNLQMQMVQEMANIKWRLRRNATADFQIFEYGFRHVGDLHEIYKYSYKELELTRRYGTSLSRRFDVLLKQYRQERAAEQTKIPAEQTSSEDMGSFRSPAPDPPSPAPEIVETQPRIEPEPRPKEAVAEQTNSEPVGSFRNPAPLEVHSASS